MGEAIPALVVEDLHKKFGQLEVLKGISCSANDGDVIAIQPSSLRFRTLYRRNSKHNSLLVTDRCNHYCLMCSQPPKDVDDRWILDYATTVDAARKASDPARLERFFNDWMRDVEGEDGYLERVGITRLRELMS